jgi:hypothetical protein
VPACPTPPHDRPAHLDNDLPNRARSSLLELPTPDLSNNLRACCCAGREAAGRLAGRIVRIIEFVGFCVVRLSRNFRHLAVLTRCSRKEVIQPQVPLRLPCYDFAPVTELAFGRSLLAVRTRTSGTPGFHGVTGGVYKARERIHRGVADPRLLAIPASCRRVAACNPNLDQVSGIRSSSRSCSPLSWPL